MDAALRFVHAVLRGQHELDAYLDAPDYVSSNVKACRKLLAEHSELNEETREAVRRTLTAVSKAYAQRNRFTHDFLRANLLDKTWELARLSRPSADEPEVLTVSSEDMIRLVCEIVAATWRLRGAARNILRGTWSGMTLGEVEGDWDGSASYVH